MIKNGSADELEGILREKGYEGLFVVYDQGYSTVKAELESFFAYRAVRFLAAPQYGLFSRQRS